MSNPNYNKQGRGDGVSPRDRGRGGAGRGSGRGDRGGSARGRGTGPGTGGRSQQPTQSTLLDDNQYHSLVETGCKIKKDQEKIENIQSWPNLSSLPHTQQSQPVQEVKRTVPQLQTIVESKPASVSPPAAVASLVSTLTEIPTSSIYEPKEEAVIGDMKFPVKPKVKGDLGRAIRLRTNHYQISLRSPTFSICEYDVKLEKKFPTENNDNDKTMKIKRLMKDMFECLISKYFPAYKSKIVYNFSKNMFSLVPLPFGNSANFELELERAVYVVYLKKIKEYTVNPTNYHEQNSINVLDLIFTQTFNYTLVNIGRSYFKEDGDFHKIGIGLELWRGAFASVRPSEIGLTWNVDVANAAFLIAEDLLRLVCLHYNFNYSQFNESQLNAAISKDKSDGQIGYSFIQTYGGRDIKTKTGGFRKKIKGFGPNSSYAFEWTQGSIKTTITVKDYLKKHYGIILKFPDLYCIDLGRNSYLPLELCSTELKHKKKLDEKETADIIKRTAVPALERASYIENWIKNSNISNDFVLKDFNIGVNIKMVEMDVRVLEAPDIEYSSADKSKVPARLIGEKGSWDHRNFKFRNAVPIKRWIVINCSFRVKSLDNLIDELIRVGKIHGMTIEKPLDVVPFRGSDQKLDEMFSNLVIKHKPLDLILVCLSGKSIAYNVIKTCGDLKFGVPTQAVEDRSAGQVKEQTVSNILLKINTKLKGRNFVLSRTGANFNKHLEAFYKTPIMILGADVTHPSPGDTKVTESIAAVVGSLDPDCSYYAARLYAQKSPRGQAYEMIHNLDKMVFDLLVEFHKINKSYPHKLVFFRDGVSEGQFPLVLRHEMNRLRLACQKVNIGYKPAITFIIVQKRHHTRFFPTNPRDQSGRAQNVPPGTIVDKTVVSKDMFDYFLCSHMGIQGTSKPCRYFVLHDENNFNMNQVQLLSHYLCHIYSRCPRSVSYPAPAYYAHLAAFRGRDYIRSPVNQGNSGQISSYEIVLHENIRNKMFFN